MICRTEHGDIIRRRVAYRHEVKDITGRVLGSIPEPELRDDEVIVRTLGDPIPRILKR